MFQRTRPERLPGALSSLIFAILRRFWDLIGIRFASLEPSIFGSFFGCVPETAVDELICRGPASGVAGWGGGIPFQEIPGAD